MSKTLTLPPIAPSPQQATQILRPTSSRQLQIKQQLEKRYQHEEQNRSAVLPRRLPVIFLNPQGLLIPARTGKTGSRTSNRIILSPSRKKLSTLESQRVMGVIMETLRRVDLVLALPRAMDYLLDGVAENNDELMYALDEYSMLIGQLDLFLGSRESTSRAMDCRAESVRGLSAQSTEHTEATVDIEATGAIGDADVTGDTNAIRATEQTEFIGATVDPEQGCRQGDLELRSVLPESVTKKAAENLEPEPVEQSDGNISFEQQIWIKEQSNSEEDLKYLLNRMNGVEDDSNIYDQTTSTLTTQKDAEEVSSTEGLGPVTNADEVDNTVVNQTKEEDILENIKENINTDKQDLTPETELDHATVQSKVEDQTDRTTATVYNEQREVGSSTASHHSDQQNLVESLLHINQSNRSLVESRLSIDQSDLIARLQDSCRNILRLIIRQPDILKAMMQWINDDNDDEDDDDDDDIDQRHKKLVRGSLEELKGFVMSKLLTSPHELRVQEQNMKELEQRTRENDEMIERLEVELRTAEEKRDSDIKEKNEMIRKLQSDLNRIERQSQDKIQRLTDEGAELHSQVVNACAERCNMLNTELSDARGQYNKLLSQHRDSEMILRKKKFQIESEIENIIQRYDTDMGERQDEYDQIEFVYAEERRQLRELDERFKALAVEYDVITAARTAAREAQAVAERELLRAIRAATAIQAFWRSHKVRRAINASKKRRGAGSKKNKGK